MSSRKVRVKKLSIKTALPVLREDQIDPSEYEALTTETQIATGVDQAEENEYHLQTILKDAGTSNDQEIPVPPPQESEINYDDLYPSQFHKPSSYIRFSQTVEECISCQYDMTVEDDEFLRQYNSKLQSKPSLGEDDFEHMMEVFEDTATEQTPFASVDNTVVDYEVMVPALRQMGSTLLEHARAIFKYWRSSRQAQNNKPLRPSLKYETHQESDDTDPYVCFRRREARQTRKTRARDQKIAETLKRLRKELEDGRQLVLLSYEREIVKRDFMLTERAIFEERARLKQMKTRMGIRGEDEDLVNQKPQRRKQTDAVASQRPPGSQQRFPVRPDGRSLEVDLVTLAEKLAENEALLRNDIENKVQNHRRWNTNHIDLTKDPLSPLAEQGRELKFRPARTQYLMTPPASTSSESMDIDDDGIELMQIDHPRDAAFQFRAGGAVYEHPPSKTPAFRRRFGRLNRLWIDRRGMDHGKPVRLEGPTFSDRWKYDSDSDDDESSQWEVDPFDTRALKFRATIPINPYVLRGRPQYPPEPSNAGHPPRPLPAPVHVPAPVITPAVVATASATQQQLPAKAPS